MAKEIERKFLVRDLSVLTGLTGTPITQAYVAKGSLRVSLRLVGKRAFLILKRPDIPSPSEEFEYSIPLEDALALLKGYSKSGALEHAHHEVSISMHRSSFVVDIHGAVRQGLVWADVELQGEGPRVLLVRVRKAGLNTFLTLKGPNAGISRDEFEYSIPRDDGNTLIEKYGAVGVVEKTRYEIPKGAHTFEVDVFEGLLKTVIIAEVELGGEKDAVLLPDWLGPEISSDMRFANSNLACLDNEGVAQLLKVIDGYFAMPIPSDR